MKRFRDMFIGILIGCMLMATPVLAESVMTKIDVILNGVNVQVEGADVQVDSILYNGSTYLPMRKVADLVGKDIEWNQETKTANIVAKAKVEEGDSVPTVQTNNDIKVYEKDGYFFAERNGELLYSFDYISKELLGRVYDVDGSRYTENVLTFFNDEKSFKVECETIMDGIYISKDYYENTILPQVN